jgi:starch synthase (maltosyl-transferring)
VNSTNRRVSIRDCSPVVDGGTQPAKASVVVRAVPALGAPEPGRHGTFDDVIARLPYVAEHGLRRALPAADPPDRPHFRKGRTTPSTPGPGDPAARGRSAPSRGRPHGDPPRARHDRRLRRLVAAARPRPRARARHRLPVLARPPLGHRAPRVVPHRPDGTIQYAENPPKKYQDIYPLDFETEDWPKGCGTRCATSSTLDRRGRHASSASTTPTPSRSAFWEWCIDEVRASTPT